MKHQNFFCFNPFNSFLKWFIKCIANWSCVRMLFLQKWSAATAEEWYINRLWQFVLSMMGLKTNTFQAFIQLITAARLLLWKNCSLTEESPLSVGNIVDCWVLPSHISPEQSRLATFPAALEASEGHFDTTVYCFFFLAISISLPPFSLVSNASSCFGCQRCLRVALDI